ncbi:MAG: YwiC-like family protein [Acidobacteriota bacterium]|nr:YwiC-like family protein [Acidobacteriota bacterium]
MLLTPFVCAAILLRQVSWQELAVLLAILCAFAVKDPLVTIARQMFVWKQPHAETRAAWRYAGIEAALMVVLGAAIALSRDWRPFAALACGAAAFTAIAVAVNVRNKQRSVWFQIASAAALTSTSIAACLAVLNRVPAWGWLLWLLCALQAFAGIFVVHARLDARIALRKADAGKDRSRRVAIASQLAMAFAAAGFAAAGYPFVASALLVAAGAYFFDMRRQKDAGSLQMPLTSVGKQALTVSTVFAIMIVVGLWRVNV